MTTARPSDRPTGTAARAVRIRRSAPTTALLLVAVCWGSSFPLTKSLLQSLTAVQYLGLRFPIAAAVLLLACHRSVRALPRPVLLRSAVLGVLYGLAQLTQTIGLQTTPATVSGFITGLYVVLTPLAGAVLLGSRVGRRAWLGAVVATAGLGVLSLHGFSLGGGEWLTLASALLFALHIVGLGRWATPERALGMAAVQLAVIAVVCTPPAAVGGYALPHGVGDWLVLLYLAVVCGALAMIVQSWSQAHMTPTRAAIVMSSEPVWAAVLSIAFFAEPLTWRILVGGGLMLAAMVICELPQRSRRRSGADQGRMLPADR